MGTCALFIDYENVWKSLRGLNLPLGHRELAELFRSEAARYGELVYARAYAPWDLFPEAMAILDRHDIKPEYVEGGRKDNADLVMSLAIQEFLRVPGRDAGTFILVTGDGDFVHVIRLLQQERKRVVVWGVEGSISARLVHRVAEVARLQDLLQRRGLLPGASPGGERDRSFEAQWELAARALVLRAEAVMLRKGWVQVPFLTLLHEMSVSTLFGRDSEERRLLIVRCLEAGILETKKQPNPKRPGTETTFVLLKKDHPLVASTLRCTHRIIGHLREILAKSAGVRAVPLGVLRERVAGDPELAAGAEGEDRLRAFLDVCAAEGILRVEEADGAEPRLLLAPDHPLVEEVVPGEDLTPVLRRLALIIDHYLTRTGYLWMSMGLLRQQLAVVGQERMERAIRLAAETGVIVVRQQPNHFGSRPTTGAYLRYDHPLVGETLKAQERLLQVLAELFEHRDVVPAEVLDRRLREADVPSAGGDSAGMWLDVFLAHQILVRSPGPAGEPGYAVQRQHPVLVKHLRGRV